MDGRLPFGKKVEDGRDHVFQIRSRDQDQLAAGPSDLVQVQLSVSYVVELGLVPGMTSDVRRQWSDGIACQENGRRAHLVTKGGKQVHKQQENFDGKQGHFASIADIRVAGDHERRGQEQQNGPVEQKEPAGFPDDRKQGYDFIDWDERLKNQH